MEMPIFVRLPLAVAGMVAGHFVSRDTLRFELLQTGIALVMLAAFITFLIAAPSIWRAFRSRRPPDNSPQ
ncbi:hypothetical protein NXC24_PC01871 (plasmid) [Rhizobium sp. NXC24]|nr:hypothetical protein NXC24_PC01871 [Rhizobium sp. NXC24]